jgi:hypothetical protein
MQRSLIAGLAGCVFLAGCQGTVGPIRRTALTDRVDNPCLTIPEQQQRVRDRLALPLDSPALGPRTDADAPFAR